MTKNQFVKKVARKLDWVEEDVKLAIDATFDVLSQALADGEEYSHRNFGKFSVVTRPERHFYSFMNKGDVTIPEHAMVKFKPGKLLRNSVRESTDITE